MRSSNVWYRRSSIIKKSSEHGGAVEYPRILMICGCCRILRNFISIARSKTPPVNVVLSSSFLDEPFCLVAADNFLMAYLAIPFLVIVCEMNFRSLTSTSVITRVLSKSPSNPRREGRPVAGDGLLHSSSSAFSLSAKKTPLTSLTTENAPWPNSSPSMHSVHGLNLESHIMLDYREWRCQTKRRINHLWILLFSTNR